MGLIILMLVFGLNIVVLHFVGASGYVWCGLIIFDAWCVYEAMRRARWWAYILALSVQVGICYCWFANQIGKGVESSVNLVESPIYSLLLFLVGSFVASYFLVKNGTSKGYRQKIENAKFDGVEDLIAAASGKSDSVIHREKAQMMLRDAGAVECEELEDEEEEYCRDEMEFEDNKAKGDYFEALIENDYILRGWEVYKDTPLDSLYKVDIVGSNDRCVEFSQCKFWNADNDYIVDGEEIYDVLSRNLEGMEYFDKRIGLSGRKVRIKFLVTDYAFIDYDAFVQVFTMFRREYPKIDFEFREVNWKNDNSLVVA